MAEVRIPVHVRLDEAGTILRQKRDIERLEDALERIGDIAAANDIDDIVQIARNALGERDDA